jgi:hypothetical protein
MVPRVFELKIWGLKFWRFRGFEHFRMDHRARIQYPCANSFEPLSFDRKAHVDLQPCPLKRDLLVSIGSRDSISSITPIPGILE